MNDEPKEPFAAIRICEDCGAVIHTDHEAASHMSWKGAWFCENCQHKLPEEEIERVAREVALRGVPLS